MKKLILLVSVSAIAISLISLAGISAPVVGPTGGGGTSATFGATFPSTGTAIGGEYLAAPSPLVDNQMAPFLLDINGNLLVNVANSNSNGAATAVNSSPVVNAILSHASTTSLGTSLVVKNAPGNLGAYNCTAITGGSAGYCVAYNATAVPGTGALTGSLVLDSCYIDTTAKGCSLSHLPNSIAASAGIVILLTSAATPFTYTTGTDTGFIEADYQ